MNKITSKMKRRTVTLVNSMLPFAEVSTSMIGKLFFKIIYVFTYILYILYIYAYIIYIIYTYTYTYRLLNKKSEFIYACRHKFN